MFNPEKNKSYYLITLKPIQTRIIKGASTSLSIYLYNQYIAIMFIAQDAKEDQDYN